MKQPENAGTTVDLMKYRLAKAESDIKSAKVLIKAEEYDDFYIAVKEETLELLDTAEKLLSQIKEYCRSRIENS